MYCILLMLR